MRFGRCLSTDCYSAHFGGWCTRRAHSSLHGTATARCCAATAHRAAATLQHCDTATLQRCNTATLQHCNAATLQHCDAATLQHCAALCTELTLQQNATTTHISICVAMSSHIYLYMRGLFALQFFALHIAMPDIIARLVHILRNLPSLPHFAQDWVTVQHTFV